MFAPLVALAPTRTAGTTAGIGTAAVVVAAVVNTAAAVVAAAVAAATLDAVVDVVVVVNLGFIDGESHKQNRMVFVMEHPKKKWIRVSRYPHGLETSISFLVATWTPWMIGERALPSLTTATSTPWSLDNVNHNS